MSARMAVSALAAMLAGLSPPAAMGQSSLSLEDLGISSSAPRTPVQRLEACLANPSVCAGRKRQPATLSMEDVVNLGIVDRQPETPQPANTGAQARNIETLPSIDMSSYLVGEAPAQARSAELGELSALLASKKLAGYRVSIVVAGDDGGDHSATERARMLAAAIAEISGVAEGRITVTESGMDPEATGEPSLTLVLVPLD